MRGRTRDSWVNLSYRDVLYKWFVVDRTASFESIMYLHTFLFPKDNIVPACRYWRHGKRQREDRVQSTFLSCNLLNVDSLLDFSFCALRPVPLDHIT